MSDRKREILNSLERMDYFGASETQLATELPVTVELFAANKTNIARLHAAGVTGDAASGARASETRSKTALARQIHSDLRRVARTAKIIERKNKDFQNVFEMPRGGLSYQELIDKADGYVAGAPNHQADFARYALNAFFFAELSEDVNDLRAATEQQANASRGGVGATADTEAVLEAALATRSELKTALENHFRADPVKLAEWLTASRIERSRKKPEPPTT